TRGSPSSWTPRRRPSASRDKARTSSRACWPLSRRERRTSREARFPQLLGSSPVHRFVRRTIFLTALLAGLLVTTSSAFAAKPGFNLATHRLEGAYKFALQDRRFDPNGCYPAPNTLARSLTQDTGHKVGVAPSTNNLRHLNQVYVLKQGTNCEQLRMALRASGGIYVL